MKTSSHTSLSLLLACLLALYIGGCKKSSEPAPTQKTTSEAAPPASVDEYFAELSELHYWAHYEFHPGAGVSLGYHQYDGRVPDRSAVAIDTEITRLKKALRDFNDIDPQHMSEMHRHERAVLLAQIRGELFGLETQSSPQKNPIYYGDALPLTAYIARDYKPLDERARAIISIAQGAETYLAQAQENLQATIPNTWLDIALLQTKGMMKLSDTREAMAGLKDEALKKELGAALDKLSSALDGFRVFLEERKKTASNDFALGEERFLRLLSETQGIDLDLATLEKIGQADLERNLKAIEAAARKIDAKKPVRAIIENTLSARPAPDQVLAEATKQAAEMRQFLIDKKIVSIPSDDVAQLRESPPFMRWNVAFLSEAGAFEKKSLPSFYYISPPDPAWPQKEQREYVPATVDLLFITIHELWPGHFLHHLHIKQNESRVLKSFGTYSMAEGWAHYTEELMFAQGVGHQDPKVHIGQLTNALLRNVRYMSALGLHAKGMTVEQSTKMFEEKAYTDGATAREQAVRGTFDPMYLSYTLGKLMILKLRDDYEKKMGDAYTLQGFHDKFLSYGAAPIPVIREAMLGENAGPVL